MNYGQVAYEAYNAHQGNKAHDGSALLAWAALTPKVQSAWDAFAKAARNGQPVEYCYNYQYLGEVEGKAMSGGPAPSWVWFAANRPDIALAWEAARVVAVTAP